MQLTRAHILLGLAFALIAGHARAQSGADLMGTAFYESGGPLHMTVINPAARARVQVVDAVQLRAGWEADVVSGASVAVVDAPGGSDVDAVTSATTLNDFRQVPGGGLTLSSEVARLEANYSYGFESDYRSHGLSLRAVAELFDRNTILELSYGRGWDSVCDLSQPNAKEAVERQRMPTSQGCFAKDKGRVQHGLDIHTFQGAVTQAWTPIFNTQLVLTAQLSNGFQSNPYRAVWLGRTAAQEHHPEQRARYAVGIGGRIWLRPIGGALQLFARAYRDTWDVTSASGEIAYERNLGQYFRVRGRGRYYHQTGAAFYSDDYSLEPAGAYFTGDRELSPMSSWLAGARFEFIPVPRDDGTIAGFLDSLRLVLKGDILLSDFSSFRYGTAPVPNNKAIFGTVGAEAAF